MLSRDDLKKVARAGITESQAVLNLAETLISRTEFRMQHCVRCHEDYDPSNTGDSDCVQETHDDTNGMIRCRGEGGWDDFQYPCCEKMQDDSSRCFEGYHISKYTDGDAYWGDDNLEEMNEDGDCSKCNPEEDSEEEDEDKEEEEDVIVIE